MNTLSPVYVDCPRPSCDSKIACTLEVETLSPKPGQKPEQRLVAPDVGPRIAEHYRQAHTEPVNA